MRELRLLLLAGAGLLLTGLPASAQWYGGRGPDLFNSPPPPYGYRDSGADRPLPRSVIMDRLEAQGFDEVGRPRFDGDVYIVEAISPAGQPVRLVVDAFQGRILRRVALGSARLDDLDEDESVSSWRDPRSAGRGRSGLPEEMPDAPRYRPGEPESFGSPPRREAGRILEPLAPIETAPLDPPGQPRRPPDPSREAGRSVDRPAPVEAAPPGGPMQLGRPADTRLAPSEGRAPSRAEPDEEPRREASRPSAAPPRATSAPSSSIYGVNPGMAGKPVTSDPKPRQAVAPTKPRDQDTSSVAPSASPAAPAPAVTAPKPDAASPTAEAANRRPVRVIPGVTPMDGGQQSSPPPQNQLQAPSR